MLIASLLFFGISLALAASGVALLVWPPSSRSGLIPLVLCRNGSSRHKKGMR